MDYELQCQEETKPAPLLPDPRPRRPSSRRLETDQQREWKPEQHPLISGTAYENINAGKHDARRKKKDAEDC